MQEIRYALFFILFNVDIYRVCLTLLLLLLSLLLNVTAFAISSLELQTFVRITVIVHKSRSPLRSPPIMKGNLTKVTLTNSLKSPLTKSPFEVGNWKLNEMAGSDGCLRQKKCYRLLKVSHKFLNFWDKTVWGNYGKHQGKGGFSVQGSGLFF